MLKLSEINMLQRWNLHKRNKGRKSVHICYGFWPIFRVGKYSKYFLEGTDPGSTMVFIELQRIGNQ